jgi:hypothetical protein
MKYFFSLYIDATCVWNLCSTQRMSMQQLLHAVASKIKVVSDDADSNQSNDDAMAVREL